ncbi:hypothetical protein FRB96_005947 [Tulasnella sp. 330]|nr:hypothetical protein FRB96_005947 [Tulasnella sp. 330]
MWPKGNIDKSEPHTLTMWMTESQEEAGYMIKGMTFDHREHTALPSLPPVIEPPEDMVLDTVWKFLIYVTTFLGNGLLVTAAAILGLVSAFMVFALVFALVLAILKSKSDPKLYQPLLTYIAPNSFPNYHSVGESLPRQTLPSSFSFTPPTTAQIGQVHARCIYTQAAPSPHTPSAGRNRPGLLAPGATSPCAMPSHA